MPSCLPDQDVRGDGSAVASGRRGRREPFEGRWAQLWVHVHVLLVAAANICELRVRKYEEKVWIMIKNMKIEKKCKKNEKNKKKVWKKNRENREKDKKKCKKREKNVTNEKKVKKTENDRQIGSGIGKNRGKWESESVVCGVYFTCPPIRQAKNVL